MIIVTDGDSIAKEVVERAVNKIGGRCISMSAGNPTSLSGKEIVELIKKVKYDPIAVMVDDRGNTGIGKGEKAMKYMLDNKEIDVIGIVAVASNTYNIKGVKADYSVDRDGSIVKGSIDKYGNRRLGDIVYGDTVSVIPNSNKLIVVGIGDPGKINIKHNNMLNDTELMAKAMKLILEKYMERILEL